MRLSKRHRSLSFRRQWDRLRRDALNAAGYRCERCKRPGRLEVHHKEKETDVPESLEVLCIECHLLEHGDTFTADRMALRKMARAQIPTKPL